MGDGSFVDPEAMRLIRAEMERRQGPIPEPKLDPVNPAHYRGDLVMRIIETFDLGFELGNVSSLVSGSSDPAARWCQSWGRQMTRVDVLDHGYVELVETWGSDERVVEAARMSTGKGFLGWSCWQCSICKLELEIKQPHTSAPAVWCSNETEFNRIPRDEKLLKFLYENKHSTPFEMAGAIIEIQAPIFVFREWHRHRTQSYSEMSARYTPLPDVNYIPTIERLLINSKTNKQAGTIKGANELDAYGARDFQRGLAQSYEAAETLYQRALQMGVPKELARVHLPVGRYSRMRASANLRNWLGFLTLRMAPGAQWEIRQYANVVSELLTAVFPRTLALFVEAGLQ